MKSTIKDVTAYIQQFDKDKQAILNTLRSLIFQTVPQAEEKLSWGVPTYYLNGYLIQFAAYERHLGFYSSPAAIQHCKSMLDGIPFNNKNTIQLDYQKPLPADLIRELILYRVSENQNS